MKRKTFRKKKQHVQLLRYTLILKKDLTLTQFNDLDWVKNHVHQYIYSVEETNPNEIFCQFRKKLRIDSAELNEGRRANIFQDIIPPVGHKKGHKSLKSLILSGQKLEIFNRDTKASNDLPLSPRIIIEHENKRIDSINNIIDSTQVDNSQNDDFIAYIMGFIRMKKNDPSFTRELYDDALQTEEKLIDINKSQHINGSITQLLMILLEHWRFPAGDVGSQLENDLQIFNALAPVESPIKSKSRTANNTQQTPEKMLEESNPIIDTANDIQQTPKKLLEVANNIINQTFGEESAQKRKIHIKSYSASKLYEWLETENIEKIINEVGTWDQNLRKVQNWVCLMVNAGINAVSAQRRVGKLCTKKDIEKLQLFEKKLIGAERELVNEEIIQISRSRSRSHSEDNAQKINKKKRIRSKGKEGNKPKETKKKNVPKRNGTRSVLDSLSSGIRKMIHKEEVTKDLKESAPFNTK